MRQVQNIANIFRAMPVSPAAVPARRLIYAGCGAVFTRENADDAFSGARGNWQNSILPDQDHRANDPSGPNRFLPCPTRAKRRVIDWRADALGTFETGRQ